MEVESVPYIFGSFSRRKAANNFDRKKSQDQTSFLHKPDVRGQHAHSKSQPETGNSKQTEDRSLRTRSCNLSMYSPPNKSLLSATCSICHHVFLEPRVLDCLHSFCTRCLQDIVDKNRERGEIWRPKNESIDSDNNIHFILNINKISCPICDETTSLTRQGVLGLPPDYVVQHRLVLATLNDENTKLLCDLCAGEVVAVERCTQCMVNLCTICSTIHKRHVRTSKHELLKLRDVRRRGLMRIHRHLMCQAHPDHELVAFCTQCEQTTCPLCIPLHHSSHRCSPFAPMAASHSLRLQRLLGKARGVTARDQALKRRLTVARKMVHRRCQKVAEEVEKYMEEYRKAIEEHRKKLLGEVENIRSSLLSHLSTFETSLSTCLRNSSTAINFTQAILEEGSDVELLTFISRLLKKLEDLEPIKVAEDLKELLKQTSKERNSEQDCLVDFVPQDLDSFIGELNDKNTLNSNENRNSKNLRTAHNRKSSNINTLNNNSTKLVEEVSSKPLSGILNQLKNCLDNSNVQSPKSSPETVLPSLDDVSSSDFSEYPTILEFLPQEPEIQPEKSVPIVFGQIKRVTSPEGNCCSISRPHLGRRTHEKNITSNDCKLNCKTGSGSKRKSDPNGIVYEITI